MDKIIYEIDNFSIIKIVGGIGIILLGIGSLLSKIVLDKINQQLKFKNDKSLQDLKSDLDKNTTLLSQLSQNHLNSSQKLIDKKIEAYEELWRCIDQIKKDFPASISIVYSLFPDSEREKEGFFAKINDNPRVASPIKQSIDENPEIKLLRISENLSLFKPYISDEAYLLFFCFNALYGRIIYNFCYEYKFHKIYNWKKDKELLDILGRVLSEKERKFIIDTNINSLTQTSELIEYKILKDFRSNLFLSNSAIDTIGYIENIEKMLKTKQ